MRPVAKRRAPRETAAREGARDAFAVLSDRGLADHGVPPALIPAVRAIRSPKDLEALLPCLRAGVAMTLTEIAASLGLCPPGSAEPLTADRGAAERAALEPVLPSGPEPGPAPVPPAGDAQLVDLPDLPVRMRHYAERHYLRTLGELARIDPAVLLAQRNIGRLTLRLTRGFVERHFGASWEAIADAARPAATRTEAAVTEPSAAASWEELRRVLPAAVVAVPLDEMRVPARARSYATREGLRTLGDLAARSTSELRQTGVERPTIVQLFEAVRDHLTRAPMRERLADRGLLESWKALLLEIDEQPRNAMTLLSGIEGPPKKRMEASAASGVAGVSGVNRMEARAIERLAREGVWLRHVRERVDAALSGGAAPLSTLVRDPWWRAIASAPSSLDYFGKKVLGGALRVVELWDERYAARCKQDVVDAAWSTLRASAAQVASPAPRAAFRALLPPLAPRIGEVLAEALFERLCRHHLIADPKDASRIVTFVAADRAAHGAAMLAFLRAAPRPVAILELEARIGVADVYRYPEVLFFGRGVVGVDKHFPRLATWTKRLVPAAIEVMGRLAPEREWHARELHEELSKILRLPAWLSYWHVGSILRRSDKVRWLGRWKFSSTAAPEGQRAIVVTEEIVRLLRANRKPMQRAHLLEELRKKTSFAGKLLGMYLSNAGILRCDRGCYGLVDRDLPGGRRALARAADHVAALLERRGSGLGGEGLRAELSALGPAHAKWTAVMCLGALRPDPRFQQSVSGAIGLSSWESVRVPTVAEVVRQCLEKGRGRVLLATVRRRIEEHYGTAPAKPGLAMIANKLGAGVQGKWLVRTTRAAPP